MRLTMEPLENYEKFNFPRRSSVTLFVFFRWLLLFVDRRVNRLIPCISHLLPLRLFQFNPLSTRNR